MAGCFERTVMADNRESDRMNLDVDWQHNWIVGFRIEPEIRDSGRSENMEGLGLFLMCEDFNAVLGNLFWAVHGWMKPHIPMRSGTLYRKFTDSALQASQGFASIQEWNLGHFTRNSRPQRCKLPKFLLLFRQKYEGAELPLLPPRLRRTLRSAPTKGGEQFAVQTFEPAKWAMTMFRNLIARWHFYVSIEKFQFTFPPLANTRYVQTSKQKSTITTLSLVEFHSQCDEIISVGVFSYIHTSIFSQ